MKLTAEIKIAFYEAAHKLWYKQLLNNEIPNNLAFLDSLIKEVEGKEE